MTPNRLTSLYLLSATTACAGGMGADVQVTDGDTIVTVSSGDCCCDEDPCSPDNGGSDGDQVDSSDDGNDDIDDTDDTDDTDTDVCADLSDPDLPAVSLLAECGTPDVQVEITFAPEVEWAWSHPTSSRFFNQVMMTPVVGNLTDDNGDGLINDNDVPDIVFTAYYAASSGGTTYTKAMGALVILDGLTGAEHAYITTLAFPDGTSDQPSSRSGVALGDIDADGVPDICFQSNADRMVCIDPSQNITLLGDKPTGWTNSLFEDSNPAIADMDGDGFAEVALGSTVYNHDGSIRFSGLGDVGDRITIATSVMMDLDGDGILELIAGSTVYDSNGNIIWDAGADGAIGVADLDLDGAPEMVVVHDRSLSVYDLSGTLLGNHDFESDCAPTRACGGPPTLADFDGDGYPEIGYATSLVYTVLDFDISTGTFSPLWSNPIDDYTSGSTGASVFDFEDDGFAEVVFADQDNFFVWRGTDGADLLGSAGLDPSLHASGTGMEYPSLADVDGDGSTEILLVGNWFAEADGPSTTDWWGVRSIGSGSGDPWANSRPVWNQHAYHMTNINDDLSVPTVQTPNWTANNTFRAAQNSSIEDIPGTPQADLTMLEAWDWCFDCDDGSLELWVGVGNQGEAASEPTTVAFLVDGLELEVVDIPGIAPGEAIAAGPVTFPIGLWQFASGDLDVVVDYDGLNDECDEDNNTASSMGLSIANECE